jgi:hypothetical protein
LALYTSLRSCMCCCVTSDAHASRFALWFFALQTAMSDSYLYSTNRYLYAFNVHSELHVFPCGFYFNDLLVYLNCIEQWRIDITPIGSLCYFSNCFSRLQWTGGWSYDALRFVQTTSACVSTRVSRQCGRFYELQNMKHNQSKHYPRKLLHRHLPSLKPIWILENNELAVCAGPQYTKKSVVTPHIGFSFTVHNYTACITHTVKVTGTCACNRSRPEMGPRVSLNIARQTPWLCASKWTRNSDLRAGGVYRWSVLTFFWSSCGT